MVFETAARGDAIARSIIDRQADEVVALATTAIRRLRMTRLDVDVVLGGGIFRNDDAAFFDRIRDGVARGGPRGDDHRPQRSSGHRGRPTGTRPRRRHSSGARPSSGCLDP